MGYLDTQMAGWYGGIPWRIVYQVRDAQQLVVVSRVARRDEATYWGL